MAHIIGALCYIYMCSCIIILYLKILENSDFINLKSWNLLLTHNTNQMLIENYLFDFSIFNLSSLYLTRYKKENT